MCKHVHSRNRATACPDIPINNPLLLLDPFDVGVFFNYPFILQVVDGGTFPIQNPSGCYKCCLSAGGKKEFPNSNMILNELDTLAELGNGPGWAHRLRHPNSGQSLTVAVGTTIRALVSRGTGSLVSPI